MAPSIRRRSVFQDWVVSVCHPRYFRDEIRRFTVCGWNLGGLFVAVSFSIVEKTARAQQGGAPAFRFFHRSLPPKLPRRLVLAFLILAGHLSVGSAGVISSGDASGQNPVEPVSLSGCFSLVSAGGRNLSDFRIDRGLCPSATIDGSSGIEADLVLVGGSAGATITATRQASSLVTGDFVGLSIPTPVTFDLFTPQGAFSELQRNWRGEFRRWDDRPELKLLSRKKLQQVDLREGLLPVTRERKNNAADFAFQRAVSGLFSGATSSVWSRQLEVRQTRIYRRFGRDLSGFEELRKVAMGKIKAEDL